MINAPLVRKTVRDNALLFGLTVAAVILFETVFVLAIRSLGYELKSFVSNRAMLQYFFRMLLSLDLRMGTSMNVLLVLGFVHPFLFATTWGFMLAIGTRITVGEIDRGTADLLLTLPLSRSTIYISTTAVWVVAAMILSLSAWLGLWLGSLAFPLREPVSLGKMGIATVNLLVLCLAVGGVTSLVSSLVDRRGVAVAILVSVLLFSFLVNFLAVFIEFFRAISFLGLLDYYRPVESVRDGTWPLRNLVILSLVALAGWTGGLLLFRRKDVPVA
jgi:ABC-type transport system involved in multi-copper enzyme maturation permease subunit